MCEQCIRAMAGAIGGTNGTATGAGAESISTFHASFEGIHQSNMLALVFGQRWETRQISFSFPDRAAEYGSYNTGEAASFSGLNGTQKQAAISAFAMLESYSKLNFTQLFSNKGNAEIRFGESQLPPTAWAYYPSGTTQGGDVWLDPAIYDNPLKGTYAWHTLLHEIGHSIGLKHGHSSAGYGALSAQFDQMPYSLMTYKSHLGASGSFYTNEYYGFAQSYMAYDIAAVQALYGVNWETQSGSNVYRWSETNGKMYIDGTGQAPPGSNRIFSTLWDGGGRDLLDLSNYHEGTRGDLSPGGYLSFSQMQKAQLKAGLWADGNIYFALAPAGSRKRAMLEDVITGSGDDFIFGNKAHNWIKLTGGKDWVHGRGGHDTIEGNGGKDFIIGGPGRDTISGGVGKDTLKGGTGADIFMMDDRSGKDIIRDFRVGEDRIDVPDASQATLTTSNTGHLTVEYQGSWAILRGLNYSASLDPLDFVI